MGPSSAICCPRSAGNATRVCRAGQLLLPSQIKDERQWTRHGSSRNNSHQLAPAFELLTALLWRIHGANLTTSSPTEQPARFFLSPGKAHTSHGKRRRIYNFLLWNQKSVRIRSRGGATPLFQNCSTERVSPAWRGTMEQSFRVGPGIMGLHAYMGMGFGVAINWLVCAGAGGYFGSLVGCWYRVSKGWVQWSCFVIGPTSIFLQSFITPKRPAPTAHRFSEPLALLVLYV